MDVKEVREILERGLDKDRHQKFSDAMECMTTHRWYWRWAQDLESNCKDALAALTSIDIEAIRADARAGLDELLEALDGVIDFAEDWHDHYCAMWGERRKEQQDAMLGAILKARAALAKKEE